MEFVHYLNFLSNYEKDVRVVQALMIEERDRRLRDEVYYEESDERLKDRDLYAIIVRCKKAQGKPLRLRGGVPYRVVKSQRNRHETSQSQVQNGGDGESSWLNLNGGDLRNFETSSNGSSTTLHTVINVAQPEESVDASPKLLRRRLADEEELSRLPKRRKYSIGVFTAGGRSKEVKLQTAIWVGAHSPGLHDVSPNQDPFSIRVKSESSEEVVDTPKLSITKALYQEITPLKTRLTKKPFELEHRSQPYHSYHHTPNTPTVSFLSTSPTHHTPTKSPLAPKDPLTHMLEKITTDFTDNLFFLHGVLRTYADADTARARADALDGAAADVLESLGNFRSRVEHISAEAIEPPSFAYPPSTSAVPNTALDCDYKSLPDFCPPISTLLKNLPGLLKAEWDGKPLDLSSDPNVHLLHEAEINLASTLRLSGATYLCSKRMIFKARLQALRCGKQFRETDAQQVCRIDPRKATKLWIAYERIGWFKRGFFEQYLGISSVALGDRERREAGNDKDDVGHRQVHMRRLEGGREDLSRSQRSLAQQDVLNRARKDFTGRRAQASSQAADSEETGATFEDPFADLYGIPW